MKLEMLKVALGGLLAVASISAGCGEESDDVAGSDSELRKGQLADGGSCHCAAQETGEDGGVGASHGKHTGKEHNQSSTDSDGGVSHGKGHHEPASADCTCDTTTSGATHGKSGDHAHDQGDAGTHGKSGDHAHDQGDAGTHGKSGDHTTK
ncbi:MAG: hypothetical protein JWN48_3693 [Myxococcaceae bacterium]|nr:hypothetical protein [Myxococcaceae bacterium]